MPRLHRTGALATAALAVASHAFAGVTNPDISVIGQPLLRMSDDAADPDRNRAVLDVGETEIVFDAYLNPYARGAFVLALGEEGIELEEGTFSILRGLPAGLAVKGGKYRAGFGKLNPVHPHAYPFAERFRLLSAYLPGEESLNETGLSLSGRLPAPGEMSITAAVDWLQGDSFRIEREPSELPDDPLLSEAGDRSGETRPAVLARISAFSLIGERSGLELGLSAVEGTNNVAARSRTRVLGADLKAKLWRSEQSYLVLQTEVLKLHREEPDWDDVSGYTTENVDPMGAYLFADYNFALRYNAGLSYERYQRPTAEKAWDQAYGLFAGYSLMEETTVLRLGWEHSVPDHGDGINTITLRAIYSMGPHKAHQF